MNKRQLSCRTGKCIAKLALSACLLGVGMTAYLIYKLCQHLLIRTTLSGADRSNAKATKMTKSASHTSHKCGRECVQAALCKYCDWEVQLYGSDSNTYLQAAQCSYGVAEQDGTSWSCECSCRYQVHLADDSLPPTAASTSTISAARSSHCARCYRLLRSPGAIESPPVRSMRSRLLRQHHVNKLPNRTTATKSRRRRTERGQPRCRPSAVDLDVGLSSTESETEEYGIPSMNASLYRAAECRRRAWRSHIRLDKAASFPATEQTNNRQRISPVYGQMSHEIESIKRDLSDLDSQVRQLKVSIPYQPRETFQSYYSLYPRCGGAGQMATPASSSQPSWHQPAAVSRTKSDKQMSPSRSEHTVALSSLLSDFEWDHNGEVMEPDCDSETFLFAPGAEPCRPAASEFSSCFADEHHSSASIGPLPNVDDMRAEQVFSCQEAESCSKMLRPSSSGVSSMTSSVVSGFGPPFLERQLDRRSPFASLPAVVEH